MQSSLALEGSKLSNPERVLVLITKMDRGGAETMSMNYYRHFDRTKVQYDFMVNRQEPGDYEDEIKHLGGRIFRMCPMYPQYFSRYKHEFKEFLEAHPEYRIIHSNLEERSYFPLKVASKMHVPVRIAHAHNEYPGFDLKTPMRYYFKKRLPPYMTQGFSCSQSAGNWLYGKKLMQSGKISTIKNAIDLQQYQYSDTRRKSMRAMLSIPDDEFVIGNVGRFAVQKNQTFLLDVFSEIHKHHPNTSLLLVGDGDLHKELETKVKKLGLSNAVRFTGIVSDSWDFLQAMDVFVMPSLHEGLPLALVEAQASGLPCVVSDVVSSESDVTGRIEFVPLSSPLDEWSKTIMRFAVKTDEEARGLVNLSDTGFDINVEAPKLQKYYLDSVSRA
ncbi:glycosyltransferase family 1 protein [Bifidobacterium sp. ESL0745]|uniref:glycosyltransferase family 1 protein n=1 Tax=Bifidobacterium sp. ESL0745 TaxID=2983226 RepID=UPI0023F68E6F|nr:glycosyltransferase family 1 protein [Bifidobacterium sp. ESL0745]MDF7665585.1 glycosyltransferase family 1 protein [Bifidobacterium sp. ESL0745]